MPCSRKFLAFIGCAALLCAGMVTSAAEKKDKPKDKPAAETEGKSGKKPEGGKKKDKKGKSEGEADREDGDAKLPKLSIPLPQGQDSKGVVIPYTDASGKKTMLFKIGVGTRLDEQHIKMADLVIETFDESGQQEMTIALPNSLLDLNTRVITGKDQVTIQRSDFQITGRDMEFNTETKQGRIKGDVKMTIYDLTDDLGATPPDTESGESKKGDQGT